MSSSPGSVDVHQHLWPPAFLDALRRRCRPPMLRGWTLYVEGEAPYVVNPAAHDVERRAAVELDAGRGLVLVSMSTPLGVEDLPSTERAELLDAWHDAVLTLPAPFRAWASVSDRDPDPDEVTTAVKDGFVGLQVGAHLISDPRALEAWAPALQRCEELDVPVLVHPGPVGRVAGAPTWWPAVHQYVAQQQAAWWAWTAVGRSILPTLRICFAAGAGLAPLHHERFAARGGGRLPVDPAVFVDTSSYGRQAVDHLTRALGIDPVVLGSDRPYAHPIDHLVETDLGDAARHAISVRNPRRLLEGPTT
jgi:predicted TIM-barrel fold metal-dependent hydrolase